MNIFNNMGMYASYLQGCYQHVFEKTPIYSWGYFYYDLSGRCLQLMSHKPLLDLFLGKELFFDQISTHLTQHKDSFYSSDIINDKMISPSIKEALHDQKYTYFFDIVHKHVDYTEIYTFATLTDAFQSNNFILNNIDILKIVSQDMAHRCRRLLTKENTLILPKDFVIDMNSLVETALPFDSLNLKDAILSKKVNAPKIQEMVNDSVFEFNNLPFNFISAKDLTLKEKELIYLYYHGFNPHRIADILEISKRTVDKHFENIKKKLDCESTGQIIPTLLRSNISINNFIKSG
ncbi:LuxR family transcriptional regulatory, chaperone HchA-associated [Legionella massiliensis]|uniref:LuxR family transcriptional regulatory, chaperone HchA-associated n=1 Tax=Legionella massiliensis TaxID=1034943 RepID=A0A078KQB3_9GAMM|nr:LuxR C-terminal-related transcriptional regulator [Legionella massiliensis]CDZ76570.1 LuxR family transcriptional regulatory, chaperone HchA-associated [Legionella massiliensis]CEE12308.1 Bacterial regulatory proteins, luxR family [Legionella massiliensis]